MDKSSIEVAKANYVARMDDLSRELEQVKADLYQATKENQELKEVEKNLRDQLNDSERECYRLESALERAYNKQDAMRDFIRKLKDQGSADARKMVELYEEVLALHRQVNNLPRTVAAAPTFEDFPL